MWFTFNFNLFTCAVKFYLFLHKIEKAKKKKKKKKRVIIHDNEHEVIENSLFRGVTLNLVAQYSKKIILQACLDLFFFSLKN